MIKFQKLYQPLKMCIPLDKWIPIFSKFLLNYIKLSIRTCKVLKDTKQTVKHVLNYKMCYDISQSHQNLYITHVLN